MSVDDFPVMSYQADMLKWVYNATKLTDHANDDQPYKPGTVLQDLYDLMKRRDKERLADGIIDDAVDELLS